MKHIKKLITAVGLKKVFLFLGDVILILRALHVLTKKKTISFMQKYLVKEGNGNKITLPKIENSCNPEQIIFQKKAVITDHTYVWEYKNGTRKASLSANGSIIIENKVLCMDGNFSFYGNAWKKDRRPTKTVSSMIVLFSQLQDGIMFGGYYDYVFLIAAKLCRIKDAFPNTNLSEMTISYPLFNTSYEADFLNLLDIDNKTLIDTRLVKTVSPHFIAGNTPYWYPNLSDIQSLKRHIAKKFNPVKTKSNRIYICRSCRRNIINKPELLKMLKKYDFLIIEDKQYTITEQISIYLNASFILGPHGASFSNIIWCEPGTHLMELFSPNYMPNHFIYLATLMDIKYSAFYSDTADQSVNYFDALVEDIRVSVPKLENCLKKIFTNNHN